MNIADNLQLAKTQEMKTIKFPARAELKLDGVRVLMANDKFYTRKSKEIFLPQTSKEISLPQTKFIINKSTIFDLEVTLESGKMVDRPKVSGMLNSAMKGGVIDESLLKFNVIDALPYEEYLTKYSNLTLEQRLYTIQTMLFLYPENFRDIPNWVVNNIEELSELYDQKVSEGYEGLVVKHLEDTYKFKRSKDWARFKESKTTDLVCINTIEGQGKYTGMIGALLLEGKVNEKHIKVKVGSGMTDNDRKILSAYYLGKTIEVKYNSITKDKDTNQASLFLPRFVSVREDK